MGLLSDLFGMDEDTEQDIKDVLKTVGVIATILFAGGAIDGIGSDDDKEDLICAVYSDFSIIRALSLIECSKNLLRLSAMLPRSVAPMPPVSVMSRTAKLSFINAQNRRISCISTYQRVQEQYSDTLA